MLGRISVRLMNEPIFLFFKYEIIKDSSVALLLSLGTTELNFCNVSIVKLCVACTLRMWHQLQTDHNTPFEDALSFDEMSNYHRM